MKTYRRKFVKKALKRNRENHLTNRDGIVWSVDTTSKTCIVKIDGSSKNVTAHFPRNRKDIPLWLRPGVAVRIAHVKGNKGYIEVVGEGRAIPAPVEGNSLPDVAVISDGIMSGLVVSIVSELTGVLQVTPGIFRLDGVTYSFDGRMGDPLVMDDPAPMTMGVIPIISIGEYYVYLDEAPTAEYLDPSLIAYYRYDAIFLDTDGNLTVTKGYEVTSNPQIPTTPTDNIRLAYILRVSGDYNAVYPERINYTWDAPKFHSIQQKTPYIIPPCPGELAAMCPNEFPCREEFHVTFHNQYGNFYKLPAYTSQFYWELVSTVGDSVNFNGLNAEEILNYKAISDPELSESIYDEYYYYKFNCGLPEQTGRVYIIYAKADGVFLTYTLQQAGEPIEFVNATYDTASTYLGGTGVAKRSYPTDDDGNVLDSESILLTQNYITLDIVFIRSSLFYAIISNEALTPGSQEKTEFKRVLEDSYKFFGYSSESDITTAFDNNEVLPYRPYYVLNKAHVSDTANYANNDVPKGTTIDWDLRKTISFTSAGEGNVLSSSDWTSHSTQFGDAAVGGAGAAKSFIQHDECLHLEVDSLTYRHGITSYGCFKMSGNFYIDIDWHFVDDWTYADVEDDSWNLTLAIYPVTGNHRFRAHRAYYHRFTKQSSYGIRYIQSQTHRFEGQGDSDESTWGLGNYALAPPSNDGSINSDLTYDNRFLLTQQFSLLCPCTYNSGTSQRGKRSNGYKCGDFCSDESNTLSYDSYNAANDYFGFSYGSMRVDRIMNPANSNWSNAATSSMTARCWDYYSQCYNIADQAICMPFSGDCFFSVFLESYSPLGNVLTHATSAGDGVSYSNFKDEYVGNNMKIRIEEIRIYGETGSCIQPW